MTKDEFYDQVEAIAKAMGYKVHDGSTYHSRDGWNAYFWVPAEETALRLSPETVSHVDEDGREVVVKRPTIKHQDMQGKVTTRTPNGEPFETPKDALHTLHMEMAEWMTMSTRFIVHAGEVLL